MDAYVALSEQGEELESYSRVVRHFGTWRRAKEALDFRHRRMNKIWRYTDDTLTCENCAFDFSTVGATTHDRFR